MRRDDPTDGGGNARLRLVACLLLATAAAGCADAPTASEVRTARNERRTANGTRSGDRIARIETALGRATDFLVARQSNDGLWRSEVYGPFRAGDALTAAVAGALLEVASPAWPRAEAAVAQAREAVAAFVDEQGQIRAPPGGLASPTYAAAGAVIVLAGEQDERYAAARNAWLAYLSERQLTESLGWSEADAEFGGWGYAADLPRKPAEGVPLGNLAEPNLSATVFAMRAMRVAGMAADTPAMRKALAFVRRCQNFALYDARSNTEFDDGGFFFMLNDPVRNKAGVAGVDGHSRTRFISYGSTTADGLRGLQLADRSDDGARLRAAWRWMQDHFSATDHPGAYAPDRVAAQASVYFYYCQAMAEALADGPPVVVNQEQRNAWAAALADALLVRQRPDGSWINTAVDVREDDPLVATSMAVGALAKCRAVLIKTGAVSAK